MEGEVIDAEVDEQVFSLLTKRMGVGCNHLLLAPDPGGENRGFWEHQSPDSQVGRTMTITETPNANVPTW